MNQGWGRSGQRGGAVESLLPIPLDNRSGSLPPLPPLKGGEGRGSAKLRVKGWGCKPSPLRGPLLMNRICYRRPLINELKLKV